MQEPKLNIKNSLKELNQYWRISKMKEHVSIGVVCLARTTFDHNAAFEIYKEQQKKLLKNIENITFHFEKDLVIEVEDARAAAKNLASKDVDGVVIISGTFHLGHLALEINKTLGKPIHLWAFDELPYDGGKIRLNSVCGMNLNASNLYKSGTKNFTTSIGELDESWIDAIRVISTLKSAHIGIAGFRARGFFNLGVHDLSVYEKLGVLLDHYELTDIMNMSCDSGKVKSTKAEIKKIFTCDSVGDEKIDLIAKLSVKLDNFMAENNLSALAIRCWPEFAAEFGISPCASMSYLQSKNRIIACEGDVEGAISMLAHRAVGAETPFLFDFSQVDLKNDFALLWHCGVAPCNLWDKKSECSLDTYFAGGKGMTADFVLKSGDISILRFDSVANEFRLFLQNAKAIPMEKELRGTYVKAKFDTSTKEVLDKVVYNGIAHHASMVYGDFIKPFEHLARIKGFEVIK
jgi:L-fucose isomerase-like protein